MAALRSRNSLLTRVKNNCPCLFETTVFPAHRTFNFRTGTVPGSPESAGHPIPHLPDSERISVTIRDLQRITSPGSHAIPDTRGHLGMAMPIP